jgi:hypothetical protein
MSTAETFRAQYRRLGALGLRTMLLPVMRDVDHYEDALAVAQRAPNTRLARAVRELAVDGIARRDLAGRDLAVSVAR